MKMTFQEIRIIAIGPCIANQLRDVNTHIHEKEGENEQIQNGGEKVTLKDDGKTVNKNEYIDIPTTNFTSLNLVLL
jgi:hypothetical protein